MSDIYKNLHKYSEKAEEMRRLYATKLMKKEITFRQFVQLSELEENKYLQNTKVRVLLSKMSGWTKTSAIYAMTSFSIPIDTKIKTCSKNEYIFQLCDSLFAASPTSWQRRIKAPNNWPWDKSIVDYIIAQYDRDDLPRSLSVINSDSRFSIDEKTMDEVKSYDSLEEVFSLEKDDTNKENSTSSTSRNTEDDTDDSLMDILGMDDEDDNDTDDSYDNDENLAHLLGEDQDESLGDDDDDDDIISLLGE